MRGEARAAVVLEDLENLFALAHGIEQRRYSADIERMRAEPQQMTRDAIKFCQNDASHLRTRRSFDADKTFNCKAIPEPVRDRGNVVHPVHIRNEHRVRAVFPQSFRHRDEGIL